VVDTDDILVLICNVFGAAHRIEAPWKKRPWLREKNQLGKFHHVGIDQVGGDNVSRKGSRIICAGLLGSGLVVKGLKIGVLRLLKSPEKVVPGSVVMAKPGKPAACYPTKTLVCEKEERFVRGHCIPVNGPDANIASKLVLLKRRHFVR